MSRWEPCHTGMARRWKVRICSARPDLPTSEAARGPHRGGCDGSVTNRRMVYSQGERRDRSVVPDVFPLRWPGLARAVLNRSLTSDKDSRQSDRIKVPLREFGGFLTKALVGLPFPCTGIPAAGGVPGEA